jgi:hypothetical protein
MNIFEFVWLTMFFYVMPLIFLLPFSPYKKLNYLPIVNLFLMIYLLLVEIDLYLFGDDENDNMNLK